MVSRRLLARISRYHQSRRKTAFIPLSHAPGVNDTQLIAPEDIGDNSREGPERAAMSGPYRTLDDVVYFACGEQAATPRNRRVGNAYFLEEEG